MSLEIHSLSLVIVTMHFVHKCVYLRKRQWPGVVGLQITMVPQVCVGANFFPSNFYTPSMGDFSDLIKCNCYSFTERNLPHICACLYITMRIYQAIFENKRILHCISLRVLPKTDLTFAARIDMMATAILCMFWSS